ncbi:MAG: DNA adenine methylase [Candidatus Izimaplasma sp.]|nr:DNA adenine methylase [Candidatus Izimaplasma bacterium]
MNDYKKYRIQPFLKWAGGKRQIIDELESRIPNKFQKYFEPFVGAGALFLHLQHKKSIINDSNSDLMTCYKVIKNKPHQLMAKLDEMNELHRKGLKDYFYSVRKMDRQETWKSIDDVTRAARLMYLNKYCYNGLYRVNSKNQFNVPYNGKKYVKLYDRENITSLSEFLFETDTKILCEDFDFVVSKATKDDLVYFDPPYDVLPGKKSFDSYNRKGFGRQGQKRLAKVFKQLDKKGCYLMLSNHNTPFISELYKDFNIEIVYAKRQINSKASGRGKIEEVIIRNY